jgi:endonuclease VIII
MPEGDTIFRAARTLHRALAGRPVIRFESVLPSLTRVHVDRPITSMTVDRVSASGKHLLIHFSGGLVLRTHMRMNGSWHVYRPGERWRRPRRDMRVLIATPEFEAVAFTVPVAEFVEADRVDAHDALRRLGPDLLSDAFDRAAAIARFRSRGAEEIGSVILNQQVVAGVGNVYKSEILFACGVNPFLTVRSLSDERLERIVDTARRLLRLNVTETVAPMTTYGGFRKTTGRGNPSERLWVYGRGRLPCRKCGTLVERRAQGPDARLTYWCPACQPP